MFLGTHKTYFSGKNRVVLPKKLRRELGNDYKFYIVRGTDGEIWGFNAEEWQNEVIKRLRVPLTEVEGRIVRRRFFPNAEECILDSQGRFVISKELVEHSGIRDEVLIIGAGDHFEIWEPKLWEQIMKREF